ncbi:hypothetical protein TURU_014241 [Turdus rufiventris]|nr:hypothetical protein TURU_014241 [Turdus rufiventris]
MPARTSPRLYLAVVTLLAPPEAHSSHFRVDYISPFRKSGGKHFVLVGVEIISGLVQAEAFKRTTGDNTVKALQEWFGTFPKPQEIQSDNESHFTAKVVQEWAKDEGVKWTFHTPYYPQANGIVERTNGLLKQLLRPQETGWDLRLWKAIKDINERTLRDMKTRQTMITLLTLLCILPQHHSQNSSEWLWSEVTIRYTSALGPYPRDRCPNLATVVLHDSEVYHASDWGWDKNDWAKVLTRTIGEEIKVGCRKVEKSLYEKASTIAIARNLPEPDVTSNLHPNITAKLYPTIVWSCSKQTPLILCCRQKNVHNYTLDPSTNNNEITKLCRHEHTDCYYNFTLTKPIYVTCNWHNDPADKSGLKGLTYRFKINAVAKTILLQ